MRTCAACCRLGLVLALISNGAEGSDLTLAESLEQVECDAVRVAVNMLQAQVARVPTTSRLKPWDVYWYLVGTNHKVGTILLRNVVGRMFLVLGATYSCQMDYQEKAHPEGMITADGLHNCSDSPNAHIRFDKDVCPVSLRIVRKLAGGFMRGLVMIRDPATILASAYCYHHRGEEYGLQPKEDRKQWPWPGIMLMGPKEGMAAISDGMFGVMDCLTESAEVAGNDTMLVRYEDITRSSEDFDRTVGDMTKFLFGELATPEEHLQMLVEARKEDLHRFTDSYTQEHTNDEGCEQQALAVLPSLPEVHAQIKDAQLTKFQKVCSFYVHELGRIGVRPTSKPVPVASITS